MHIYNDFLTFKANKPVLTVGIFDGVHRGHAKILKTLTDTAKLLNGDSAILTFWPHPQFVIKPYKDEIQLLNTLEEKIKLLEQSEISHLIIFPFTKVLSEMPFQLFVEEILVNTLKVHTLIVGYDNHIGRDKDGGFEQLKKCSEIYNFNIIKVDEECINNQNLSSTKIRNALNTGDIEKANIFLGYNYSLTGKVIKGNNIGITLGFPTANIEIEDRNKLIPPTGVYAVEVIHNNRWYQGILNKGFRPTIEHIEVKESVEIHIIDFDKDIYGETIIVKYIKKIRDEIKFENIELLKQQIKKDKEEVIKIFNYLKNRQFSDLTKHNLK